MGETSFFCELQSCGGSFDWTPLKNRLETMSELAWGFGAESESFRGRMVATVAVCRNPGSGKAIFFCAGSALASL